MLYIVSDYTIYSLNHIYEAIMQVIVIFEQLTTS